jgi:hypothetical protein
MYRLALIVTTIAICASAATVPMYKIAGYSSAPFSATVADVNDDGGKDIIVLAKDDGADKIFWFENKYTMGTYGRQWEEHQVDAVGGQYFVYADDLDGANYLDIVHSNGAGYLNDGSADGWKSFSVDTGITAVGTADINDDGDVDVVYAGTTTGGWYENAGNGSNWTAHTDTFENKSITPLDADGDNDWDVLTIYEYQFVPSHFYIAENMDGTGGSWNEYEIDILDNDNVIASRGVAVLNANGNSTADVCIAVVAETAGDVLALSFDTGSSVTTVDEGTAYSIVIGGDFDNDGLDEIVAYDFGAKATHLFDNLSNSPNRALVAEDFKPICAGDVNGDGAVDVLGYMINDDAFVWLDFQQTLYPDVVTPAHVPTDNMGGVCELFQSKPNPSYGDAVITFVIPETANVRLSVYDITGREIEVLENGILIAGEHTREVSELPAGVYMYRLAAGSDAAVKKMVVLE